MTDKLKQIIKEKVVMLPKEMQEVLNIFDWGLTFESVGKKYFLIENEVNNIQTEIGLVLVGLVDQADLALNIEKNAGLSNTESKKITEEIEEKILTPMMQKLNENIKKSLPNRSIHWQQNLDFILSGGDYTAFIRRVENEKEDEIPKANTFNPSKLDDLKSKFTI